MVRMRTFRLANTCCHLLGVLPDGFEIVKLPLDLDPTTIDEDLESIDSLSPDPSDIEEADCLMLTREHTLARRFMDDALMKYL